MRILLLLAMISTGAMLSTGAMISTGAAWAHSSPERTVPADRATVARVEALAVSFDKPMRVTMFTLSREGESVAVEREQGMEPVTRFSARPDGPLEAGTYEVEWRGLSEDGHAMQGGWSFTVEP